jgi:hypothetical protein
MRMSLIATALVLGGVAASAAQAMPMPAVAAQQTPSVVKVDYACGPGWHVTPWGHCRPNRAYLPPRYGWARRPPPPPYAYRESYYRPHYYGWYRPPPARW